MSRSGDIVQQPSGYKAFIPKPLPPHPPLHIDEQMQVLLERANIALGRLDAMCTFLPHIDHIIAMYVRKEALLSSQIEGTQASLEDIFAYESKKPVENIQDVKEVVNYIKALNHGLQRLEDFPMSIRLIKEIHTILLHDGRGKEKTPGEFRRSQNWIGATGCTLKEASFVPPPPHEAHEALGKLELFLHEKTKLPLLVICALIHYQFETIHPFLDGNGRLGRLLITFYLCWKKVLQKPLLYLSYYLKLHRQEYYDRLNLVRQNGDFEQWISFFLKGIIWTSESALETIRKILTLTEEHKKLLLQKGISTPLAIALLDHLLSCPHISVKEVSDLFHIGWPTANTLVSSFEKIGILKEITSKKRNRQYTYWEYLDFLSEGANPI
jgi:Fic family protein